MKILPTLVALWVFIACLVSCNWHGHGRSGITIKWSTKVDSLLRDTAGVNYVADSLKKQLLDATHDTAAINSLNDLAQMYDKFGLVFSDEALKQSQKIGYQYGITDAICRRGIYFFKRDKFDSLNVYLDKSMAMAEKYNEPKLIAQVLFFRGENCRLHGTYDKAMEYYRKADSIALKIGDKYRLSSCLCVMGEVYRHRNEYDTALAYYNRSIKFAEEMDIKSQLSFTFESMGDVYRLQNNYVTALQYYSRALELAKQLRSKLRLAGCYSVIGDVYRLKQDTVNELLYFNKAIPLAKEIGDKSDLIFCLSVMSDTYVQQGKYNEALKNYTQAMELSRKINSKNYISYLLGAMAKVYMGQGDYDKAQDYYTQSLEMDKELGDKNYEAIAERGLGELYLKRNDVSKAKEYANQSLASAQAANSLENIADAAELAFKVDQKKGDYKNALDMHLLYSTMRDSINAEEIQKQEVQKEVEHEYANKESEMRAAQENRDLIAKAASKRQRIAILLIVILAVSTGIISLLIFRSLKTTNKQKKVIEEQKLLVEQKNKDVLASIAYAKYLQDAIIPPLQEIHKVFPQSFVLYRPKDIVAGDFYWMELIPSQTLPSRGEGVHAPGSFSPHVGRIQEGMVLIAAADCTGHGVPGAMVSVLCSNALNSAVKEFHITEPGKVLDKTSELIVETFEKSESEVQDGMDISLLTISYQPSASGSIEAQWAGANNSLLYVRNNEIKEIPADKQPIGNYTNAKPFTTHTITLQKGDALYLFTDGYADQFGGPKGKKFKYRQLQETLLAISSKPMAEQGSLLEKILNEWRGNIEQVDDVLIIGIKI